MNNNWYVITGGPCSGKTTVLHELKKLGYGISEEAARIYIDIEIQKGKTLDEIRKDELFFQNDVLTMKITVENNIDRNSIHFFDRGIPDTIAYFKANNYSVDSKLKELVKKSSYKKIFLFELLEYKLDYARTEDIEKAIMIETLLEKTYITLQMECIRVPVMPVHDRVTYILKNL